MERNCSKILNLIFFAMITVFISTPAMAEKNAQYDWHILKLESSSMKYKCIKEGKMNPFDAKRAGLVVEEFIPGLEGAYIIGDGSRSFIIIESQKKCVAIGDIIVKNKK